MSQCLGRERSRAGCRAPLTEPLLRVRRAPAATPLLLQLPARWHSLRATCEPDLLCRSKLGPLLVAQLQLSSFARGRLPHESCSRKHQEGNQSAASTQDGEEGAALPLLPQGHGGSLWQAGEGRGCLLTKLPLHCHLFPRLPFIRYNFPLLSHTFLLSCQNSISELTAEMAELSMLIQTPLSSFLLQLQGVCSSTCRETITLSLYSQLSASRRAELFKANYVSIKSSEKTTTAKNKRPLSSGEKNWPFSSLLACFLTSNQWPGGMDRNESDPGLVIKWVGNEKYCLCKMCLSES